MQARLARWGTDAREAALHNARPLVGRARRGNAAALAVLTLVVPWLLLLAWAGRPAPGYLVLVALAWALWEWANEREFVRVPGLRTEDWALRQ